MKPRIPRLKITWFLAVALIASALPSMADYIPLPIKWSQPIGFDPLGTIIGVDRLSAHPLGVVRADDFQCNSPLPIVAVRWWGSYLGEGPGTTPAPRPNSVGFAVPFDISFHDSTIGLTNHPFSLPRDGTPLLLQTVAAQEFFVGVDMAGHWVYRYDAYLVQPFNQTPGKEYFIDIDKPFNEPWGWHETPFGGLDFPAVAPGHFGPWANDPPHDLAFELMVMPEPGPMALSSLGGMMLLLLRWRRAPRNN